MAQQESEKQKEVVIIGSGPAGLLAAMSALDWAELRNQKVTIIEKRKKEEYTRHQETVVNARLFLDLCNFATAYYEKEVFKDIFLYIHVMNDPGNLLKYEIFGLKKLIEKLKTPDKEFFLNLIDHEFVIPIKEIESYLSKKLDTHIYAKSLTRKYEAEVIEVNELEKEIKLKDAESIKYEHLILAEGAGRKITRQTTLGRTENEVSLSHHQVQVHGTCLLRCKKLPLKKMIHSKTLSSSTIPDSSNLSIFNLYTLIQIHGWHLLRQPVVYSRLIFDPPSAPDMVDVYITGEIPEKLSKMLIEVTEGIKSAKTDGEREGYEKQRQEIIEKIQAYFITIVESEFPVMVGLLTPIKDKTSVFKLQETALKNCSNENNSIMVIGDAYLPACYLYGHGIHEAFEGARVVRSMFEKPNENYQASLSRRINEYNMVSSIFYKIADRTSLNVFRQIPFMFIRASMNWRNMFFPISPPNVEKLDKSDRIIALATAKESFRSEAILKEMEGYISSVMDLCKTLSLQDPNAYRESKKNLNFEENIDYMKLFVQIPHAGNSQLSDAAKSKAIINACILEFCKKSKSNTKEQIETEQRLISDLINMGEGLNLESPVDFDQLKTGIVDTLKRHKLHVTEPTDFDELLKLISNFLVLIKISTAPFDIDKRLEIRDKQFIEEIRTKRPKL